GNAEEMIAPDGTPHTAHTTNPVPFIVAADRPVQLPTHGKLADVAPVIRGLQGW
ncbi:MAG: 2,3-bisphosphoglycerate-independent phosphoglycerate mutase, partial [Deinococcus sp.]|nr:2,3-bisphosphoglycerate-independent phosphoglycerate mutase [Deinococcus sp.]